ncbi:MAG: FAD:protein FMN transferase, partial [Gammaproteobacteria bacterium]
FVLDGRHFHHVLNPETGLPAQGVRGVAMVARDVNQVNGRGAMAMLLGPDAAAQMLSKLPGTESVLVNGDGRRWLSSPGMARRLATPAAG